jgi:predicted negative regulator of RcsB-dependent stress response
VAIYDTEEEQLEQLKKWWGTNNTSIIAGVIGAIVLVSGFNYWKGQQFEKQSQASDLYQKLLNASASNNQESVLALADKISTSYGNSAYQNYALLETAKIKVEQGDIEAAKTLLQKEINNSNNPELAHLSRLRLIQLLIETKQYEEGLKLIQAVDPSKREGFASNYDEIQGDLYLGLDRVDEARTAYQSALRTGQASPLVQFKLDDITAPAPVNPASTVSK